MVQNYIRIAIRSLWKNRFFTGLHVLGLSMGMAACLLIFQYLRFEWSYDRQSPHAAHIWRAYNQTIVNGAVTTEDANTHSALGPALRHDLPDQVVDHARIFNRSEPSFVFLKDNVPHTIDNTWAADPGFLRLFPQRAIAGHLTTALDAPFTLVLARSAAERMFGSAQAALEQKVRIPADPFNGWFTIKAVVEDPAPNNHIKFKALVSYATRYAHGHQDNWDTYWEYNYFQLAPHADPERVRAQLAQYSQSFLKAEGISLQMQRLTDIHLHSNLTYEIEPNGSARSVRFLGAVALLVLLIAFINFINLATARMGARAREVGTRKALGAGRQHLTAQFLIEGAVVNTVSSALSLWLVLALLPVFAHWMGRPLDRVPGFDATFYLSALGLWASGIVAANLWPAIAMSGMSVLGIFKEKAIGKNDQPYLRKALVVFQFACSVVLIVAVLVIYGQLSFMKKHDKGLSLDQMLTLRLPKNDWRLDSVNHIKMDAMKREVSQLAGVQSVAASYMVPGVGINTLEGTSNPMVWSRNPSASAQGTTYFLDVEKAFFETFGIRLLAGQVYDPPSPEASDNNIMINEAAMRMLGFASAEAAIGEEIAFSRNPDRRMRVHGVVANFHIESLKQPPKPTLYYCRPWLRSGYLSVKTSTPDAPALMAALVPVWQSYWPECPLEWQFLDQQFDAQYRSEQQLGEVFGGFAGLAVLIACLGLFGLAAHTAERRTKEIGIRKVLGASVASIAALLANDFLKLIAVAIVLAVPVAYFLMEKWLADFAYRIQVQWWMFAVAGLASVVIACVTIGFQGVRAALANPVKALRSE
jgi:putative ABC transport system permease protein